MVVTVLRRHSDGGSPCRAVDTRHDTPPAEDDIRSGIRPAGPSSGSYELQSYPSAPRPVVEVAQNDLLPCAEFESTVPHGHRERGADESGAHVRVPVAVTPTEVVFVFAVARRHDFEGSLQVGDRTTLILDRSDSRSGPGGEHHQKTFLDNTAPHELLGHVREVYDVRVSCRLELSRLGTCRHSVGRLEQLPIQGTEPPEVPEGKRKNDPHYCPPHPDSNNLARLEHWLLRGRHLRRTWPKIAHRGQRA